MPPLPTLFDLSAHVAVVTGGAGLLGTEFCNTLYEAGASVVVADIDLDRAQSVAESITRNLTTPTKVPPVIAIRTDVTEILSVKAMVDEPIRQFGRLDILENSAVLDPKFDPTHGNHINAFEDFPLDAWNQALEVNLTGTFLCSQAAVVPMLKQGKGVIINLSSIYGITGPDQRLYQQDEQPQQFKPIFYSVTKTGMLGLTRYLATYYAGKNIRVNALSPGGVYNGHDKAFVQAYSTRTVLGRMAEKSDMNGALLFLASNASSYMTGANLVVDGGWSVW